jgi:hypothetical protein
MALLVNNLQPIRGRDKIISFLLYGRDALVWRVRIDDCEWLDPSTLLLRGAARFREEGSGRMIQADVWWLDEFREGLLWRVRAFLGADLALDAYQKVV